MARIILAIHDLGRGGSEKAIATAARLLAQRGHTVTLVLTLPNPSRDLEPLCGPQVSVVSIPFSRTSDIGAILRLRRFVRVHRPDAVLSASFPCNVAFKAVRCLGTRFPLFVREGNVLHRHSFWSRLFDRFSAPLVTAYIVNAHAIKEDLMEHLAIRPGKIHVVYNGLDEAAFNGDPEVRRRIRAELGAGEDTTVVLHVGSMSTTQKGQELLLEAFAALPESLNTMLVFAGEGRRRQALQSQAAATGRRIRFLGARTDVPALLRAADVFAFPSLWEGMPNAVLEAMAAGVPVVATPVGGIPEVIVDGESGILVPAGQAAPLTAAIRRLIEDPALRESIGRGGSRAVAEGPFRWNHFADTLERILLQS